MNPIPIVMGLLAFGGGLWAMLRKKGAVSGIDYTEEDGGWSDAGRKMGLASTQDDYKRILADASESWGYPRSWFPAIALWEGRGKINPTAVNRTGGDLARGGAYGAMQITMKTADAAGFKGRGEDLFDVATTGHWAGKILSMGPIPETLEEMAALWNAGRLPSKLPAGHITLTQYIPGVMDMEQTV
jgi:hypothetical protein